jgi:hypothetical protein
MCACCLQAFGRCHLCAAACKHQVQAHVSAVQNKCMMLAGLIWLPHLKADCKQHGHTHVGALRLMSGLLAHVW